MKYNMTEPCDACPFLIGSGRNAVLHERSSDIVRKD